MWKYYILKFRTLCVRKPESKITDRWIRSMLSHCWRYVLLLRNKMAAVLSETVTCGFGVEMGDEWLIKYSCNRINTGLGEGGGSVARTSSCSSHSYRLQSLFWLLMLQNSDSYLQFVLPWETLQRVGSNLMAWLNSNTVSTTVRAKEPTLYCYAVLL
jgi:hypothetical protein